MELDLISILDIVNLVVGVLVNIQKCVYFIILYLKFQHRLNSKLLNKLSGENLF